MTRARIFGSAVNTWWIPAAILLAGFGWTPPAAAQIVTLEAAADTYLKNGSANRNQGDEDIVRVRSSGKNRVLVRFDATAPIACQLVRQP